MTREEKVKAELVRQHDRICRLLLFSNRERRRVGVTETGAELRRQLRAIGYAITQNGV